MGPVGGGAFGAITMSGMFNLLGTLALPASAEDLRRDGIAPRGR